MEAHKGSEQSMAESHTTDRHQPQVVGDHMASHTLALTEEVQERARGKMMAALILTT